MDTVKLPKNIRQIGTEDSNRKIYIEDYAYSFIKDIVVDEDEDGAVGILLGEKVTKDDETYVFIKGAMEIENAAVFTDKIAFTYETWPVVKNKLRQYFDDLDIVGWYLVSSKITEAQNDVIEDADFDTDELAAAKDVLFRINNATAEECFYEYENDKLQACGGYIVYYERNEKMQNYMNIFCETHEIGENVEETASPEGEYRKAVEKKKGVSKNVKKNLTLIYALSMVLIIVVLIIGINGINKFDKKESSAETKKVVINTKEEETVPVDSAGADITTKEDETKPSEETTKDKATEKETEKKTEKQTEKKTEKQTEKKTEKQTEKPTKKPAETTTVEETTKPVETTTAPPEPQQTTHTIAMGDTLYKICEIYYGTQSAAGVNRIMEANGLTSADLTVGKVLIIPN